MCSAIPIDGAFVEPFTVWHITEFSLAYHLYFLTMELLQLCYLLHQLVECNMMQWYDRESKDSSNNVIEISECHIDGCCINPKFTRFALIFVLHSFSVVSYSLCNFNIFLNML